VKVFSFLSCYNTQSLPNQWFGFFALFFFSSGPGTPSCLLFVPYAASVTLFTIGRFGVLFFVLFLFFVPFFFLVQEQGRCGLQWVQLEMEL